MKERYDSLDEYIADLQAEIAQSDNCANHFINSAWQCLRSMIMSRRKAPF